jgi:hypothetical protein
VGALMGWFKLDDTLTLPDEPLSAFLGYGLTRNVNAYPSALRRLGTFAYPTTSAGAAKVKWASYYDPRGTVLTVDVGINATDFVFNVFYRTTNAAIGGQLYVRHIDSGAQVVVNIAGTASPTSVEIPFTTTQPLSGLQGFMVGFQSDVSEEGVGSVEIDGAVGNQVFCSPAGGAYPFTLATGYYEMYHLIKFDAAPTRPAPSGRALLNYQVCAFRHNVNAERPPHGVLLIWPEIEIQPAILPTDSTTSGGAKILADIYELGRLELFSITVEVARALDQGLLAPLAYQQTTIINGLNNQINASMMELQPDAGSLLTSDGYLGCVLPADEEATFAFFIQVDDSVQQLLVSFQCVTFNADQTTSPDITFGVRDALNTAIGSDIIYTEVSVPRFSGQPTRSSRPDTTVYMNGVLAGDEKWGMRDAMLEREVAKSTPVRFTWGPNVAGEFTRGSDGSRDTVYYGRIVATCDLYIFGFNCRVL